MASIGSGIASQLMVVGEASWGGGVPGTPVWRPLEFKSETLELKKTTVQGQGLHAGGLFDRLNRRVLTNYDVNGGITLDLPNRGLALLLQHMTGSPYTTVSGAAALATPTELTTTLAYQSYHTPGNTGGMGLCFQKGVPTVDNGTVEPFTYVGSKINDWEISVATGAIAQLALTIDARSEIAGSTSIDPNIGSVPTLASWTESGVESAADPLNVFHFREAAVYSGGTPTLTAGVLSLASSTALGNVTSANIKETHTLDTSRYFLGSAGFKGEQIENGFRQVTGGFDVEWLSTEAMYAAFAKDTTTSIQLSFVGNLAGTSGSNHDTLILTVPNIKLDGESPKVGGPGLITQSVSFTGLDDEATAPYQFNYISSDAAI